MTPSELQTINQIATLSSAAKAEAAKALGFIHRFQWTVLVGGVIIGAAVEHFVRL